MVQFKRNSTSKGSGLSIYSLVSEKNSTAPSCTASGNRTSKKLLYKCSLQPVWKREITHWPFWAFPLSCHLCNKPLNNQMHRDFQVLINSLPLHFHKRTCDNIDSRLPNPVLESFPHSQPCASPSQRTQTNSTRSRCKWTPSCYHLLESFSPASQDAMKHMIEPTWLITWTLLLPQGPRTIYTQSFLFTEVFHIHVITGHSSAQLVPERACLHAPLHHVRPTLCARTFIFLMPLQNLSSYAWKTGRRVRQGQVKEEWQHLTAIFQLRTS